MAAQGDQFGFNLRKFFSASWGWGGIQMPEQIDQLAPLAGGLELCSSNPHKEPYTVLHFCNPSIDEAEIDRPLGIHGQPL